MEQIESGAINAILTWKPDRLARNMVEGGKIIHALQTGALQLIQTPHSSYRPHDNTLPLTIELGMANQYSRDLSVNIKRGNKTKLEKGGWCSIAPQGYLNDRLEKTVIPDLKRFHLVRKMWDLALTGQYSLPQICDELNEKHKFISFKRKNMGGKPLAVSSLYRILLNPFYYGRISAGGIEGVGRHKAMITEEEFHRVQKILSRGNRRAETNYLFALTDLIKCGECSCSITAEEKIKYACPECKLQSTRKKQGTCKRCEVEIPKSVIENSRKYTYYRCTKKKGACSQPFLRKEALELQLQKVLAEIEMNENISEWSVSWLKYINEEKKGQSTEDLSIAQKNYDQVQGKLNALLDLFLEGGIEKTFFEEKKTEIETERDAIKKRLSLIQGNSDGRLKQAAHDFELAVSINQRFRKAGVRDKKFIVKEIGSNFLLKGQKLTLDLKPQYNLIRSLDKDENEWFEPPNNPSNIELDGASGLLFPKWYYILERIHHFYTQE